MKQHSETYSAFLKHLTSNYFSKGVGQSSDYNRSIISWYIQSVLGIKHLSFKITDGPSDGNIDAVITKEKPRRYTVIQSKFSKNPQNVNSSTVKDIRDFEQLINQFGDEKKFNAYLTTVDSSLKDLYKKVFMLYQQQPEGVTWVFLCTSKNVKNRDCFI